MIIDQLDIDADDDIEQDAGYDLHWHDPDSLIQHLIQDL